MWFKSESKPKIYSFDLGPTLTPEEERMFKGIREVRSLLQLTEAASVRSTPNATALLLSELARKAKEISTQIKKDAKTI